MIVGFRIPCKDEVKISLVKACIIKICRNERGIVFLRLRICGFTIMYHVHETIQ